MHHYHRAAGELYKFCFSRGGGSHAEFIAGILDRMAAGAAPVITIHTGLSCARMAMMLSPTMTMPHHG
jgi:hypothetical protein